MAVCPLFAVASVQKSRGSPGIWYPHTCGILWGWLWFKSCKHPNPGNETEISGLVEFMRGEIRSWDVSNQGDNWNSPSAMKISARQRRRRPQCAPRSTVPLGLLADISAKSTQNAARSIILVVEATGGCGLCHVGTHSTWGRLTIAVSKDWMVKRVYMCGLLNLKCWSMITYNIHCTLYQHLPKITWYHLQVGARHIWHISYI